MGHSLELPVPLGHRAAEEVGEHRADAAAVGDQGHPPARVAGHHLLDEADHALAEGGEGLAAGDAGLLPVGQPHLPDLRVLAGDVGKMHALPVTEMKLLEGAVGDDRPLLAEHQGGGFHRPAERAGEDGVHLQGVDPFAQGGGLLAAVIVQRGVGGAHEYTGAVAVGLAVADEIEFGRVHGREVQVQRKTSRAAISTSSMVAPMVSPVMPPSRVFR